MSKSIRLLFHLCLVVIATLSLHAHAQDLEGEISDEAMPEDSYSEEIISEQETAIEEPAPVYANEKSDGNIEVHYSAEVLAPFEERKTNWSVLFNFSYEDFYPENFKSPFDGASTPYTAIFGSSSVPLFQLSIGTKYNMSFGSLGVSAFYGMGEISADYLGDPSKLEIQKYGGQATFALDALFSEPWVVPYVSMQYFTVNFKESATLFSKSSTTGFATGFVAGALIQLNALDPNSALRAQSEVGLDNTFINLYMAQNGASADANDPDFSSTTYGAGFTLEF